MDYNYFPLIRTSASEFTTWENLENKENITPIIELTRGRKIRNSDNFYFFEDNNFSKITKLVNTAKNPPFIGITLEQNLLCKDLENLISYKNGYESWIKFLQKYFKDKNITPVLNIDPDTPENEYINSLKSQFEKISNLYNNIAYRAYILTDRDFLIDLNILSSLIYNFINKGGNFTLILDHETIRPNFADIHADATSPIIDLILSKIPEINILILSNSYQKSSSEIFIDDCGFFNIEEIQLFKEIKSRVKFPEKLLYGDYTSINPVRNDTVIMSNGWIPKIEIPLDDKIYYFRQRTKGRSYMETYHSLAQIVTENEVFKNFKTTCWAKEQIIDASNSISSTAGKSTPRFWISVRAQLFIVNIINQLQKIYSNKNQKPFS